METPEYYKRLMQIVATSLPSLPRFNVPLSMRLVANMRLPITELNKPASYMFIGSTVWGYIIADEDFQKLFDPVTKHELLTLGHLGVLLGMSVFTDGFFEPEDRVFNNNLLAIAAIDCVSADTPVVRDITAVHCDTPIRPIVAFDPETVRKELAGLLSEIKALNTRT